MSIKKFVYSFFKKNPIEPIVLNISNNRSNPFINIVLKTVNNNPYQIDYGDGDIITNAGNSNPVTYELDLGYNNTSTKIYVERNNVEELGFLSRIDYNFDISELHGMFNLKSLSLSNEISFSINDIPDSVRRFYGVGHLNGGYQNRRSFTFVPMSYFYLGNESGGLTTSEVDNLLNDLSSADWVGEKKIYIKGNNEPRSSSSDSYVTTLENKGVSVYTY